jgi:hypothetical protein
LKASHYNQIAFAQNVMAEGFLIHRAAKTFLKTLYLINLGNAPTLQLTKWMAFHVARFTILNNIVITKKD